MDFKTIAQVLLLLGAIWEGITRGNIWCARHKTYPTRKLLILGVIGVWISTIIFIVVPMILSTWVGAVIIYLTDTLIFGASIGFIILAILYTYAPNSIIVWLTTVTVPPSSYLLSPFKSNKP